MIVILEMLIASVFPRLDVPDPFRYATLFPAFCAKFKLAWFSHNMSLTLIA